MRSISDTEPGEYARLAQELGITEGAFKVRVHRFRQKFRDTLLAVVREMVSSKEELALVRKFALE